MAEKSSYPLAPSNGYSRSDGEAAYENSKELRRKKRIKCLLYLVAFAVFQTGVILLFVLTVMKLRTPKFRVRSATFETFNVGTESIPTFDLVMNAQLGVKNTNFGEYKYQNSTIYFFYMGNPVGEAVIHKSKAGWRSTKKFNVVVNLSSSKLAQNSNLGTDLSKRLLPLTSQSKLEGKVELMKVLKKKRSTEMSCTMEVVIASRELSNIRCN